jgi:hypothetical protein
LKLQTDFETSPNPSLIVFVTENSHISDGFLPSLNLTFLVVVAHKAIQVYYAPHPIITRNNADWWFIIKTKARGMIEDQQVGDFAYQEDFPDQNSGGISVDIDLPTT